MTELCPICGNPTLPDDHLCARCRYFQNAFNPPVPQFEDKRERAVRAIQMRKIMKNQIRMVKIE
jgi:predicted amidophosphoribosyltransferase